MLRPTRLPIFGLLVANAVSVFGNTLTVIAIPWFVLQTTDSAAKTGLTGSAIALALALGGFFGGPVVDRLGAKRSSIVADLASGSTVALVPLLYGLGLLQFWLLLTLVFLSALLDAPGMSARMALIPDLAERARMPKERANSASQVIENSSELLAPALGGVLIVALGASNVLWIDAATFVVSAAIVAVAVPSRATEQSAGEDAATGGGYLANLAEGLRFVWRDRLILTLFATAAILNFLFVPLTSVILPIYADSVFGSAANLGIMLAGFSGGALAGGIAYGAVGHRLLRRATYVTSLAAVGLPFWLLALTPALPVTVLAVIVMGIAFGPINPLAFTLVQERTTEETRGRVFGALMAISLMAAPLGATVAGYSVEVVGLSYTLLGIAALYLSVTLSLLFQPALREMDEPVKAATEPESRDRSRRREESDGE